VPVPGVEREVKSERHDHILMIGYTYELGGCIPPRNLHVLFLELTVFIIKFVYGCSEMVRRQNRGERPLAVPYDPTAIAKLPSIERM
jgi:hypothetical protein